MAVAGIIKYCWVPVFIGLLASTIISMIVAFMMRWGVGLFVCIFIAGFYGFLIACKCTSIQTGSRLSKDSVKTSEK